jgi:hypothetical protein
MKDPIDPGHGGAVELVDLPSRAAATAYAYQHQLL